MSTLTPLSDQPTSLSPNLQRELEWLTGRGAADADETRQRLFGLSQSPTHIPEGKTLSDMVEGQWPGDETNEQVREALERLS
jgi:hypothetical protein